MEFLTSIVRSSEYKCSSYTSCQLCHFSLPCLSPEFEFLQIPLPKFFARTTYDAIDTVHGCLTNYLKNFNQQSIFRLSQLYNIYFLSVTQLFNMLSNRGASVLFILVVYFTSQYLQRRSRIHITFLHRLTVGQISMILSILTFLLTTHLYNFGKYALKN